MLYLFLSLIIFSSFLGDLGQTSSAEASPAASLRLKRESKDINLGFVNYTCANPGVYPHETRCELYYNCGPDYTILFQCDQGLVFDLRYNGCNYEEYVDCGNRTRPGQVIDTTTIPLTTSANENPCTEEYGNVPDPARYCTSNYYICIGYQPYPEVCPGGNIFDPVTRRCANPANSTCNVATSTAEPSKCPATNGFFPNWSQQCTGHFYTCVGGIAYETICPANGIFDPSDLICIPQNSGNCSVTTITNPIMTTTATATTMVPSTTTKATTIIIIASTEPTPFTCPGSGFYPDPNDCSQYYHCDPYSVATLQKCPSPLVFNPAIKQCDWIQNVPSCSASE